MSATKRNIAVKSNPLPPTNLHSGAEDLSSAEMPEVIVVADKIEEGIHRFIVPPARAH